MTPVRIHLLIGLCLSVVCFTARSSAQTATDASDSTVKAEREAAIHQVEKIVNQTVPAFQRTKGMHVSEFKPGWFHPGAIKPDFNNVDVRTTRETAAFDQHEYCSSDLNPGLAWRGRDLEFNSMTKYFYTNRTFPKKRLTEAEMLEINRLYRIIGKCEQQLSPPSTPDADTGSDASAVPEKRKKLLNPYIGGLAIIVLALLLIAIYKRKG